MMPCSHLACHLFATHLQLTFFCEIVLSKDLHLDVPMRILGGTAGESQLSFTHKLLFALLGTSQALPLVGTPATPFEPMRLDVAGGSSFHNTSLLVMYTLALVFLHQHSETRSG